MIINLSLARWNCLNSIQVGWYAARKGSWKIPMGFAWQCCALLIFHCRGCRAFGAWVAYSRSSFGVAQG